MRRTIIILNRFTTFIRSWRGKLAGLTVCFLVVLVLSCKDDAALIGFPKESRLTAHYFDVPLNPSVLYFDGVLTRNNASETLVRILVGRYNDPQFGNMEARGYANIVPPNTVKSTAAGSTFDSLVLQLKLDYYYFGTQDSSAQRLQVFEVLDTIKSSLAYYSNSSVNISSQLLGENTFSIVPSKFDNAIITGDTASFRVRIRIQGNLGPDLLNDLTSNFALFSDVEAFTGKYKGLAFITPEADKVFGINPKFSDPVPKGGDTKLSLYYSEGGVRNRQDFLLFYSSNYALGLSYPAVSFSTITTDHSATTLNGIQPFKDHASTDNRFFVQGGTALTTKFDLTNFYNYIDTIDHLVFNSAEVVVSNVAQQRAPTKVQLRILDSTNHFRSYYRDSLVNGALVQVVDPYFNKMVQGLSFGQGTSDPSIDIRADQGVPIPISANPYQISGIFITEFCQQAYKYRKHPRRVTSFALMPSSDEFRKTVSGLILDPATSLRIYYSKPVSKVR